MKMLLVAVDYELILRKDLYYCC